MTSSIDVYYPPQIDLELAPLSLRWMMRPPASEPENRTHGAKKIGPSQYSDFFNKIDPQRHFATVICRIAKGSLALDVEVLIF